MQDVAFIRDGEDLIMQKRNSTDQITILSQFKDATDNEAQVVVNWEFANGQILKAQDVNAVTQLTSAMAAMGSGTEMEIGTVNQNSTDIQLATV